MKFFTCHLAKTTLSFLRLKGKIVTMVNFLLKCVIVLMQKKKSDTLVRFKKIVEKKNCGMVLIKCKTSDNQYIFDQNIMGPILRLNALLNGRPL